MDSLRDLANRAWRTFGEHPAAAMQTFYRLTRGPQELRAVDAVLEAVFSAGWRGQAAVTQYHIFSNLILAASGTHAARLAAQQESDSSGLTEWVQEYHPARPADYPYVTEVRNELRDVDSFAVFTGQVEAVLASMAAQVPD
jgi:hypothetical protein